ncbi:MAG: hypothetical protein IRZ03_02790 [Acidobacterium ailaaui]|nr:hypothetical protein [Pseudacidobacterium ailaaui]
MRKMLCSTLTIASIFLMLPALGSAQEPNPATTYQWPQNKPSMEVSNGVPVYKIQVVGRDIPAINYFHRSGKTEIGFAGTPLLPEAKGTAEVESHLGRTSIHAKFKGLKPANAFGVEYLTYVLWAITPEGRPVNLGEVLPDGTEAEMTVTTDLQSFGLIVTAEPYFAVTMPSDAVVLQNQVLPDKTQGIIQPVNAHASLLPRGSYGLITTGTPSRELITRNDQWPLELYEAINAVQIAEAAGAAKYASDTFATAKQELQNAMDMQNHESQRKQEISYARAAVQTAEDARIIALRKKAAEDQAQGRSVPGAQPVSDTNSPHP